MPVLKFLIGLQVLIYSKNLVMAQNCKVFNTTTKFVCFDVGRYNDPNDPLCDRYYLCTRKPDGSFIETLYSCPIGKKFDTSLGLCSEEYFCPYCASSATVSECESAGRFDDPEDPNCVTYYLCTQLPDGSFIRNLYSCEDNYYFDPSKGECSQFYNCSSIEDKRSTVRSTNYYNSACDDLYGPLKMFTCSLKGRFYNPWDVTCTTYFLCSLLRNGSFIQTKYSCPEGSHFDPQLQLCSINYQCPCSHVTSSATTTLKTTTSNTPVCLGKQNDIDDFICSERGRFFNPKDETCTKYFLCSLLRNGSFIQTEYMCPSGSYFDPELHLCSILYKCPCSTLKPFTTSEVSTSRYSTSVPTKTTELLISTTVTTTTKKSPVCFATQNNTEDLICSEKGRFFNPKDETCTKYFLCNLLRNGSFIQTEYTCPSGSYFDPELHRCSLLYQCPCSTDAPSTPTEISISTKTTELPTAITTTTKNSPVCPAAQNNTEDFICSERGKFFNPKDETCTKYFLCNHLRNGTFIQTEYTCPLGSYFDPELHLCSIFYQCPCPTAKTSTTTETSTSKSSSSISTETTILPTYSSTITTTTKTSPVCFATQNSTADFICSERGRYFNPKDETCTKYFLCSLLRNGSFIQTEYSCPMGSYFDPELHLCSTFYQCPCPTAKPSTTTETSTSKSSSSISTETTIMPTYSSTITTTTKTSPVCFAVQNNTEDFICSERGRFFNPKDETCTKYFLCSLLRNGSFIQTEYSCPMGSYFDPELHLCSISYHCPCPTAIPSTTIETSTSKSSSSISTETTALPTYSSTITTTTKTSPVCFATQNSTENFKCSERGRFFNPKDETCTKYFLCSLLRNGSFIQTEYSCPMGSYFDPELHLCNILYQCPCPTAKPSTTTEITTSKFSSSISTEATELPTNSSTITTTTKSSPVCFATQNSTEDFICSERGRFFNPKDETCTKYFLCSLLRNGSFIQTEYSCPMGSYFDPELHLCSILYQCPCPTAKPSTTTETTSSKSSSSISTGITALPNYSSTITTTTKSSPVCFATQNSTEDFVCSEKGRFFNPKDETCTKYFLCSLLRNGSFIQTEYSCPMGSYFDPELHLCNILYQCPCPTAKPSTTTEITTSKFSSSISTETTALPSYSSTMTTTTKTSPVCFATQNSTEDFKCSEKGRFFNPKDETCSKYFLCSLLRNGSFIQTEYSCPMGSYFDPELHLCNILYQCPCPTAKPSTTTEITSSKSSSSTSTEATELPTNSSTITTTTKTPPVCFATQNSTKDFICSERGRFFNPKDETCTKYFLCSLLRNGSFIQTEYNCPMGSYFDPELHLCNILYQCPCRILNLSISVSYKNSSSNQTTEFEILTTESTGEMGRLHAPHSSGSHVRSFYSCFWHIAITMLFLIN